MQLVLRGAKIFAGTGGREFDPALPAIVFLHGAGLYQTVWALLARWFAHRGFGVLAPDLPGHGRSEGEPLGSIAALETAVRHPDSVDAIGLIAIAAAMPVAPDLLTAAQTRSSEAAVAGW